MPVTGTAGGGPVARKLRHASAFTKTGLRRKGPSSNASGRDCARTFRRPAALMVTPCSQLCSCRPAWIT
ncbi:hypothetical protein NSERUTF1_0043 [Nocardia seriolae]|nr:hypothetical protein NSERUTF1_0043 [Nocardia seriolae]